MNDMGQTGYHCQSCGASITFNPYIRNKYGKSIPLEPETKRQHFCIAVTDRERDNALIAHARLVIDAINDSLINYRITWTAEGVPVIRTPTSS